MDLRSDVDRTRTLELVRECDVFVAGYRWGSFARRGFGPEELRKINPRLIYVEANAYGFQGPWAERRGWEQLAQATTGLAELHSAGREASALVPAGFQRLRFRLPWRLVSGGAAATRRGRRQLAGARGVGEDRHAWHTVCRQPRTGRTDRR